MSPRFSLVASEVFDTIIANIQRAQELKTQAERDRFSAAMLDTKQQGAASKEATKIAGDASKLYLQIDQAYKMIPSTMKAIHFNIPENRNMFIPNVNRPLVKVYNGEEWVFKSLENVTRIVSDNIRDNIESWTNRYDKKLSPTKKKALNAFVAECIEGKMQMLFKDELKMFLMTYSQKLKDFVNEEITNKLEDLQIEIDPEDHE